MAIWSVYLNDWEEIAGRFTLYIGSSSRGKKKEWRVLITLTTL